MAVCCRHVERGEHVTFSRVHVSTQAKQVQRYSHLETMTGVEK
jgi:hypothetical protein